MQCHTQAIREFGEMVAVLAIVFILGHCYVCGVMSTAIRYMPVMVCFRADFPIPNGLYG